MATNAARSRLRGFLSALVRPWNRSAVHSFPVLHEEQKKQFERDGYLVFDPRLPVALLDRIVAELKPQFARLPTGMAGFPLAGRLPDAWKTNTAVKELAKAPRVLAALRELYGREPLPFQTLNFPVGTEQAIHSDTIHFNSRPSGGMCGVWIALEDIDLDNGPLVYFPGSQNLPEITLEDVGVPVVVGSHQQYPRYERFIAKMVEATKFQPSFATIRKGQALIWASNLLHGGMPRRDLERSRFSQVTHYFFQGYRFFTPLFSTPDETCWRNPEWIA